MEIQSLPYQFTVCKLKSCDAYEPGFEFSFLSVTDEEISLLCKTSDVPSSDDVLIREDGWKGFRIVGVLDFSLIGILSKISGILADNKIGIFAVSTFNTDYIFVKEENFGNALTVLGANGYTIV